jgi:hypothetical protein
MLHLDDPGIQGDAEYTMGRAVWAVQKGGEISANEGRWVQWARGLTAYQKETQSEASEADAFVQTKKAAS